MRIIVQRCLQASVRVNQELKGSIGPGLMLLVGITSTDTPEIINKMAEKVVKLRIFDDANSVPNLGLLDQSKPAILSISQFTLYADCRKGNRPNYLQAAPFAQANALWEHFNNTLRTLGIEVACGVFGADMDVALVNSGPMTIILDSDIILK